MESEKIYRELGQIIKRLRRSVNWIQARLLNQIGISRASLANIEAGRQQILVHPVYAIAKALELASTKDLMPSIAYK